MRALIDLLFLPALALAMYAVAATSCSPAKPPETPYATQEALAALTARLEAQEAALAACQAGTGELGERYITLENALSEQAAREQRLATELGTLRRRSRELESCVVFPLGCERPALLIPGKP